MSTYIQVIITVSDTGDISMAIDGPVNGKEGITYILNSAQELVDQGDWSTKSRPR